MDSTLIIIWIKNIQKIDAREYIESIAIDLNMIKQPQTNSPMISEYTEISDNIEDNKLLNKYEAQKYMSIVGSLRYLTTTVRPDIAYAVRRLSHTWNSPTIHHLKAAKKVLGYVQNTPTMGLLYKHNDNNIGLYVDASYKPSYEKCAGVSGVVIMRSGAPVYWNSRRISVIVNSTMDVELLALQAGVLKLLGVKSYMSEIGISIRSVKVYEDNQSLEMNLADEEKQYRTTYLRGRYLDVQMAKKFGEIEVERVDTNGQIADMMTKPLGTTKAREIYKLAGIINDKDLTRNLCYF